MRGNKDVGSMSLNLGGSRNLGKITGQFLAHSSTFRC